MQVSLLSEAIKNAQQFRKITSPPLHGKKVAQTISAHERWGCAMFLMYSISAFATEVSVTVHYIEPWSRSPSGQAAHIGDVAHRFCGRPQGRRLSVKPTPSSPELHLIRPAHDSSLHRIGCLKRRHAAFA